MALRFRSLGHLCRLQQYPEQDLLRLFLHPTARSMGKSRSGNKVLRLSTNHFRTNKEGVSVNFDTPSLFVLLNSWYIGVILPQIVILAQHSFDKNQHFLCFHDNNRCIIWWFGVFFIHLHPEMFLLKRETPLNEIDDYCSWNTRKVIDIQTDTQIGMNHEYVLSPKTHIKKVW